MTDRRENFEQLVTDILFELEPWLSLPDGPTVDDARETVMRELLAHDRMWAAEREAECRIFSLALSLALKGNVRDISAAKDELIKRAAEMIAEPPSMRAAEVAGVTWEDYRRA